LRGAYDPGVKFSRLDHVDWLRFAGLFTYACVGVPLVGEATFELQLVRPSMYLGWWVSYLVFGVTYWSLTRDLGVARPLRLRLPLLIVMSASWALIGYFSESALPGILLLVLAGVLPWIMPLTWAIFWLALDTLALIPVLVSTTDWTWMQASLQCVLYLGFTVFTFVTSLVAKGQAEAREVQRRLNAELRATRALLAESSRIGERLRISRDLHDLLGHHLTALLLNLEVASHVAQGPAQERVRQAQTLAKLLLADVREAVSTLRSEDSIELTEALHSLIDGVPGPQIHLEAPERFAIEDPRRAQVILRCAQEVITNTIRHAGARNLWLSFEQAPDGTVRMHARDDGQGAPELTRGNGLKGMQERLTELGGRLQVKTGPGEGFELDAELPLEANA
jgi:signal transduction histidine kinase